MKLNSLYQKNIKNVKSDLFNPQKHEYIFTPEINHKSKMLDQTRFRKMKQSMDLSYHPSIVPPNIQSEKHLERIKLFNFQNEMAQQKIEQMKFQKQKAEFSQCTFHPKINQRSVDIHKEINDEQNPLKSVYENTLHHKTATSANLKLQLAQKNWEANQKLLEECTFKPNINSKSPRHMSQSAIYPKDYEKSIGRVRFGHDEKVKKQGLLNYVNRGEFLEFRRTLPMNPPRCADNYIIRAPEPFMYLNIVVRGGKKGTIALRKNDIPEIKAEEFAAEFQLEGNEQEQLQQMIEEYIGNELMGK